MHSGYGVKPDWQASQRVPWKPTLHWHSQTPVVDVLRIVWALPLQETVLFVQSS